MKVDPQLVNRLGIFAPSNEDFLDQSDGDLSSGGVLLLPPQPGCCVRRPSREQRIRPRFGRWLADDQSASRAGTVGAFRPGRKAKARRPASWPSAAPARGSGVAGEGLPVQRHLARGSGAALRMPGQHRCYEQAPGRNQPMRRRWRHRFARPRRCRLAQLDAARWARQHCARAASTLRAPSAPELNLYQVSE